MTMRQRAVTMHAPAGRTGAARSGRPRRTGASFSAGGREAGGCGA